MHQLKWWVKPKAAPVVEKASSEKKTPEPAEPKTAKPKAEKPTDE